MLKESEVSELYQKYAGELLRYIYSFVRSHDSAEDILHEAFERLIRYSREHPVDLATARPFLYTICRNRSIDHIKVAGRISASDIDDHLGLASGENVQEEAERRDLLDRVHALIDRKDPVTRSVFYMKAELGKTYEEIAADLRISERTAKRKMKALLEYLAAEMESAGYVRILSILVL